MSKVLSDNFLLSTIIDFYNEHNRVPKSLELKHRAIIPIRFGSLNKAISLAGLIPNTIRDGTPIMEEHNCPQCSITFVKDSNKAKKNLSQLLFCSLICSNKWNGKRKKPRTVFKQPKTIEEWMSLPWDDVSWEIKRRIVIHEQNYCCAHCNLSNWTSKKINDQPINFQVDHIDGNFLNNDRNNLEALCPNCHSNTDTWIKPKIDSRKVTDEEYKEELKVAKTPAEAMRNLGLSTRGNAYTRARRLLAEIEAERLLV